MKLTEALMATRLKEGMASPEPTSDGYAEIEVTDQSALKCAAVLVPLVLQDDEWRVILTRRTTMVESHKGQVSFPGGACDARETTPEETALREAAEELGILASDVRLLGRLGPLVTISGYKVTPVVGVVRWPYVFRLATEEVERVFTIPLVWLSDQSNRWEAAFPGRDRIVLFYHPYDSELLWGASARIVVALTRALGLEASPNPTDG